MVGSRYAPVKHYKTHGSIYENMHTGDKTTSAPTPWHRSHRSCGCGSQQKRISRRNIFRFFFPRGIPKQEVAGDHQASDRPSEFASAGLPERSASCTQEVPGMAGYFRGWANGLTTLNSESGCWALNSRSSSTEGLLSSWLGGYYGAWAEMPQLRALKPRRQ